jgi:phage/plasmid-associated DNA primase
MTRREYTRLAGLDADPGVTWAGGRCWSLLTAAELPERKMEPRRRSCAVAPATGPHPAWDALLCAVWPGPEVRARAVREIAGVALRGATPKQHPVPHGQPGTGKSTVADRICRLLGSYAVAVEPSKLIGGRAGSAAEEARASLTGARMAWLDEPPTGARQAISTFNELASGTGDISASRRYHDQESART